LPTQPLYFTQERHREIRVIRGKLLKIFSKKNRIAFWSLQYLGYPELTRSGIGGVVQRLLDRKGGTDGIFAKRGVPVLVDERYVAGRLYALDVHLLELLDVIEDVLKLRGERFELRFAEMELGKFRDLEYLGAGNCQNGISFTGA
jgi:hypothetical protein